MVPRILEFLLPRRFKTPAPQALHLSRAQPAERTGAQALNFLWLNLDLPAPPDPADGSIRQPLPQKYIDNVRQAGAENPGTDVLLWVDSRRLTPRQIDFLKQSLEEDRPHVRLKDLRSIPAYDKEPLYDQGETDPNWRRCGQTSMIWRQVDAAKILISLQGNYDQTFFSDLDHAHLGINTPQVQDMLKKRGIMIGSSSANYLSVENQLWGYARRRRGFFEEYYETGLKSAYAGRNAWSDLCAKVRKDLQRREGIALSEICLPINGDGSCAEQPGHTCRDGYNADFAPELVASGEVARVFNARNRAASPTPPANLPVAAGQPPQAVNS